MLLQNLKNAAVERSRAADHGCCVYLVCSSKAFTHFTSLRFILVSIVFISVTTIQMNTAEPSNPNQIIEVCYLLSKNVFLANSIYDGYNIFLYNLMT